MSTILTDPRPLATAMRQQDEDTREALRDLRRDLVVARRTPFVDQLPPPRQYSIVQSRRAHHALVHVHDGDVEGALKKFKRQREDNGLTKLLSPKSHINAYYSPGERRRARRKANAARRAAAARKRAAWAARRDPEGRWS